MTTSCKLTIILCVVFASVANAQIRTNSFMLPSNWSNERYTTFSTPTQTVSGAPVAANVVFSGAAQRSDGNNRAEVKYFSNLAQIVQLSRYNSTSAAGVLQYSIDLSNYDAYLSDNGLMAEAIEIRLNTGGHTDYGYDVYLSYAYAPQAITRIGIDTSVDAAASNYTNIYAVGNAGEVGSIAGGTLLVLAKSENNYTLSMDVADLYNSGVRQFELIIASANFGQNRNLNILETSGVFLTAVAIPESGTYGLIGGASAMGLVLLRKRRSSK